MTFVHIRILKFQNIVLAFALVSGYSVGLLCTVHRVYVYDQASYSTARALPVSSRAQAKRAAPRH